MRIQLKVNGEQVKGIVKETWGDLTDDEITQLEGNRQKLSGKIQERYGRAEDVVEKKSTTGQPVMTIVSRID